MSPSVQEAKLRQHLYQSLRHGRIARYIIEAARKLADAYDAASGAFDPASQKEANADQNTWVLRLVQRIHAYDKAYPRPTEDDPEFRIDHPRFRVDETGWAMINGIPTLVEVNAVHQEWNDGLPGGFRYLVMIVAGSGSSHRPEDLEEDYYVDEDNLKSSEEEL